MLFRNLRHKPGVTLDITLAEVHLPVRLGHRDAQKTFIDPLSQQIAAAGLGTITGFDARQISDHEVVGLDIHLGLTNASRESLGTIARMLEHLRSPCGSSIRLTDTPGDPVLFGTTEGLELSIGTDCTPDVDARKDLAQTCRDAIAEHAVSRGWTKRADQTLFYFYGESFQKMKQSLADALESHPRFSTAALRRMA